MSTDTQYLTEEKFAELEKELNFLKTERRKEVAEHLEYSKKLGDLSENAEYHAAREEQHAEGPSPLDEEDRGVVLWGLEPGSRHRGGPSRRNWLPKTSTK